MPCIWTSSALRRGVTACRLLTCKSVLVLRVKLAMLKPAKTLGDGVQLETATRRREHMRMTTARTTKHGLRWCPAGGEQLRSGGAPRYWTPSRLATSSGGTPSTGMELVTVMGARLRRLPSCACRTREKESSLRIWVCACMHSHTLRWSLVAGGFLSARAQRCSRAAHRI